MTEEQEEALWAERHAMTEAGFGGKWVRSVRSAEVGLMTVQVSFYRVAGRERAYLEVVDLAAWRARIVALDDCIAALLNATDAEVWTMASRTGRPEEREEALAVALARRAGVSSKSARKIRRREPVSRPVAAKVASVTGQSVASLILGSRR